MQSTDAVLREVAERIVAAYLVRQGYSAVRRVRDAGAEGESKGIDVSFKAGERLRTAKVKADPYFGLDRAKAHDRSLPFYRNDAGRYAFESISNSKTREPGWILSAEADELFYYWIAVAQTEEEVRVLLGEPDDVLFSELQVERDDLRVLPMAPVKTWFAVHSEEYTPRPVTVGGHIAWFRLIPREDIDRAIPGIKAVGPVLSGLFP
jgi:hypothetical protein